MYRAFGLLLPESNFTLPAAAKKMTAVFPGFQQQLTGDQLSVFNDSWEIHLNMQQGPEVLEESEEIAEHIGGTEDALGIRRCNRRVEVSSDFPDPEMEHFDDYLKVIEVLQTFDGLIAIDPQEPSLI